MTEGSLHHMVSTLLQSDGCVDLSWQVTYVAYSCSMLGSATCQKFRIQRQVSN